MDVATEIAALRREVTAMAVGLTALAEAQTTQTELLRALLEAATGNDGGEGGLGEAIRDLVRTVAVQSETLAALRIDLAELPTAIAAAGKR